MEKDSVSIEELYQVALFGAIVMAERNGSYVDQGQFRGIWEESLNNWKAEEDALRGTDQIS